MSYDRLTIALEDRTRELRHSGATVLLVDIADNGGGTEWAEAAARIVSRSFAGRTGPANGRLALRNYAAPPRPVRQTAGD